MEELHFVGGRVVEVLGGRWVDWKDGEWEVSMEGSVGRDVSQHWSVVKLVVDDFLVNDGEDV